MTGHEEIVRLAARGDGVTRMGAHVSGSLPGDIVDGDEIVSKGAHHVDPPCRHFSQCGGCQLQYADDDALETFVRERVINTAMGQGLEIDEVLPVHLSPPKSRRRATLHAQRTQKGAVIGYRKNNSHSIVDLAECHVIDRRISSLVAPLRSLVAAYGPAKSAVDVQLAIADQGVDIGLSNFELVGLEATEAALDFALEHKLARLTIDQGYGPETVYEPEPATITLAGIPVGLPPGAFLQATLDAEAIMVADARAWLGERGLIADLFAGLGTFAFALGQKRKVLAVEADRAAYLACKSAGAVSGGTVVSLHRDLFRNPLREDELSRFTAALLDPPRAGAKAQIEQIAQSNLARVVYVSCNPSSWARDARRLLDAGFALKKIRPVGQFRWSTHVELISLFER